MRKPNLNPRLLVMGAGSGASNNLIRSLRAGDPSLVIVGCNADRFVLKKSLAGENHLIPSCADSGFGEAVRHVVETEGIDLLIPNSDPDVRAITGLNGDLRCRLFLPARRVIELCQDKYELTVYLRSHGIPAPRTHAVTDLERIEELFLRLGSRSRFWCRIRTGGGSMGAIPVKRAEQARSWIRYWEEMRGVPAASFTISEYLPGRDFSLQCLWNDGTLVLAKMSERLSYFGGAHSPSGVSSTPALGKTVLEPRVVEVCTAAIRAVDPKASGVFCFDLKEDEEGVPCVTEINAGRFAMITNIYDLAGRHNMAVTYVRLALDLPLDIQHVQDFAEDYYLVRDLDTLPGVFHAEELFEGMR